MKIIRWTLIIVGLTLLGMSYFDVKLRPFYGIVLGVYLLLFQFDFMKGKQYENYIIAVILGIIFVVGSIVILLFPHFRI